jgi:succinate dehydrogenase / fumarate reductase membrane anchor subunit
MDQSDSVRNTIFFIFSNSTHRIYKLDTLMAFGTKLVKGFFSQDINEGTTHWLSQRVTSAILIPLTAIFMFPFVVHINLEHSEIIFLYANPFRAMLTLLFFCLTLLHFKQGAQVVIEDYVHDSSANKVLLRLNEIVFWIINGCIVLAMARIMFST